jgi:hypothetical protein
MIDGDKSFVGLDMRTSPSSLREGFVCESVNARYTDGTITQRAGMLATRWTTGAGGHYNNVYQPKGAAVFTPPNTSAEYIVIASGDGKVYATSPNNTAWEVPMPAGVTIDGDVKFVQCFDKLIMLRGEGKSTLELADFTTGFTVVQQEDNEVSGEGTENPSDGTIAIPESGEACFFANRLLVVDGRDEIAASDYLNYTRYAPTFSQFRVNKGTGGRITAIHPVDDNTLAVFKQDSVYLVSNVYGDLADIRLDELTRNYGCVSSGSVTKVGADLYFLSRRGVCSISVTQQGHIQGVDVPLSRDIQPLIDQIDWAKAGSARGAFAHNRLYLAVPLVTAPTQRQYTTANLVDDAGDTIYGATDALIVNYATDVAGNNCVLVFDFLTGAWAGIDLATGLSVKEWLQVSHNGTRRLCFLGNDGFIYVYDDVELCGYADTRKEATDDTGFNDNFKDYAIPFLSRTREYGGSTLDAKKFMRAKFAVSTSNATLTVSSVGSDAYNVDEVATITRSRTRYIRPFDREPYDPTNINLDHATEGREDYSVIMQQSTTDSGVVTFVNNTTDTLTIRPTSPLMEVIVPPGSSGVTQPFSGGITVIPSGDAFGGARVIANPHGLFTGTVTFTGSTYSISAEFTLGVTTGITLEGTIPNKLQHFVETRLLRTESRGCSLMFENDGGHVKVHSAAVEFKTTDVFATRRI